VHRQKFRNFFGDVNQILIIVAHGRSWPKWPNQKGHVMTSNFLTEARSLGDTGMKMGNAGAVPSPRVISPLMLSDQLMTLAQDADRAGLRPVAGDLLRLALRICESRPTLRRPTRQPTRRRLAAPIGGSA
jgi:hypothetical protein